MKVILDKILVKPAPRAEYKGLLHVPANSDEGMVIPGTVVEVGTDVTNVKVGNLVYFNKFNSPKVNINTIDYLVLTEKEVLVVVA